LLISPPNSAKDPLESALIYGLFTARYTQIAENFTKIPESYQIKNHYSKTLVTFYTQVIQQSNDKLLTLAQIGLGANIPLLLLWKVLREHNATQANKRVHLSIFDPHGINTQSLSQCWQQLGLFEPSHPLRDLAQAFLDGQLANITGPQRFIFEDGKLCVDIHLGQLNDALKEIPTPVHGIQYWHCLPSFYAGEAQSKRQSESPNNRQEQQLAQEKANNQALSQNLWKMSRISADNARIYLDVTNSEPSATKTTVPEVSESLESSNSQHFNIAQANTAFIHQAKIAGFSLYQESGQIDDLAIDHIALNERNALRQQISHDYAHCPCPKPAMPLPSCEINPGIDDSIAIIGGGIAAACLALSLAERGLSVTVYCQDDKLADGASGNRQGAIYPLLTPDNSPLSQFFQQAYLFSRRRLTQLTHEGFTVSHALCGVLQTGFDDRSQVRLNKIIQGQDWPSEIARSVTAKMASELAGVSLDKPGFYYPLGGWISPHEFAAACLEKAATLAKVTIKLSAKVDSLQGIDAKMTESGKTLHEKDKLHASAQSPIAWALYQQGNEIARHQQLVLACGPGVNQFSQTQELQMTGFRGQVSHVPAKGALAKLKTVICANGYLTPAHDSSHCVGASYIKDPQSLEFSKEEQAENGLKMRDSFPNQQWPQDIDVSDMDARVGVRMVTRDHFPMMGSAADVKEIESRYQALNLSPNASQNSFAKACRQYWQNTPAPVHQHLYVLGGLGSRGLSSAPLAAECLAAQLCGEIPPLSQTTLTLLNPNRMWMRKLLKGKAL
jgi:tRNA 5-methylaminomethyl-2-thiouridine biosynthesis bifunctional protein